MEGNVKLALGRDFAEAAAAGVTFNLDDGQAVVSVLADTLEGGQQALVDVGLDGFGLFEKFGFLFLGIGHDDIQFSFLVGENLFELVQFGFGFRDLVFSFCNFSLKFGFFLVCVENDELLIADFLVQGFVFAVVADVVLLFLIFFDGGVSLLFLGGLVGDFLPEDVDFLGEIGDTGAFALAFVLLVADFLGKFTADDADIVDFGADLLKMIEGEQFLLDGDFFGATGVSFEFLHLDHIAVGDHFHVIVDVLGGRFSGSFRHFHYNGGFGFHGGFLFGRSLLGRCFLGGGFRSHFFRGHFFGLGGCSFRGVFLNGGHNFLFGNFFLRHNRYLII